MASPFPKKQEGLRDYILRKERKERTQSLLRFVPTGVLLSVFTPLWLLSFIAPAIEIYLMAGLLFWLVEICLYLWGPEGVAWQVAEFWLLWAVVAYFVGLLTSLCRCVRVYFPWETPEAHPVLPDDAPAPADVMDGPSLKPVWKRSDDNSFWMANVAVPIQSDGYHAFEAAVETPAAPLSLHVMSHPMVYVDKEEQVELRSVSRAYGRFHAGEYRFFLFVPGGGEPPDATLTRLCV